MRCILLSTLPWKLGQCCSDRSDLRKAVVPQHQESAVAASLGLRPTSNKFGTSFAHFSSQDIAVERTQWRNKFYKRNEIVNSSVVVVVLGRR